MGRFAAFQTRSARAMKQGTEGIHLFGQNCHCRRFGGEAMQEDHGDTYKLLESVLGEAEAFLDATAKAVMDADFVAIDRLRLSAFRYERHLMLICGRKFWP